jgi:hypothetical protein
MEFFLRDEEIASPASARPYLFDALRAVLAQNGGNKDGAELCAGSAKTAAKTAKAAKSKTSVKDWERTAECFLNMLYGAGILLDETDNPISLKYARWSTKVNGYVEKEMEVRALAYLAFRIIVCKGGISVKEVPTLGLAIYQQGKEKGPSEPHDPPSARQQQRHLVITARVAVTVDFPHCRVQLSSTRLAVVSNTFCCIRQAPRYDDRLVQGSNWSFAARLFLTTICGRRAFWCSGFSEDVCPPSMRTA